MEKTGLYVHFPFCRRKCPYCHFASRPSDATGAAAWMHGLLLEADRYRSLGLLFDTLYFGGGTPSLLPPDDLARIVDRLRERLGFDPAELTLEANPSTEVGPETMSGWARAGVTRLSVGVQSFDDGVLEILGREATAAEAERFIANAVGSGFFSVGLDLMTGVPGETRAGLEKTLTAVARLRPDHASVYLLENVEGLPFETTLRERPVADDDAADAFEFLAHGLDMLGLRRYEISNFARPGRECRHNLKYWRYEPFLGLGPSAASHIGQERWTNADRLEDWLAGLERRMRSASGDRSACARGGGPRGPGRRLAAGRGGGLGGFAAEVRSRSRRDSGRGNRAPQARTVCWSARGAGFGFPKSVCSSRMRFWRD